MERFLNLTTRTKLSAGFGLICTLLVIVILSATIGLASIKEAQRSLYNKEFSNARDLLVVRSNLNDVRASLLSMLLESERSNLEFWHRDIDERSRKTVEIIRQLQERNRADPTLSDRLEALNALSQAFRQTRDDEIIKMIYAGQAEAAKTMVFGIQDERKQKMRDLAKELGERAIAKARTAMRASEQNVDRVVRFMVALGIVSILFGLIMVQILNRVIAVPLKAVTDVAGLIASGDLTVRIADAKRTDEVGKLMNAFGAIGTLLKDLRRLMLEINEAAGLLSTSSAEILTTTTQVAAGAAETASAVSETTATVEEVKQTAQVANQKAGLVSDKAKKSTQASQTGRKSVENAIEGMRQIQEQMEFIADSIVRLSEQNQAIGEIIATVNELAEQSNLLAVNAAIEASKVSEQGKGFAVVAQEVKSLAEQSKQATGQIRSILGEIQKATNAAVLATERGSKSVQTGVQLSTETGQSIRILADTIGDAAQAVVQIAASSQQQMAGMDQIALAMENIKQASLQNMSGTRQAEAAAKNLHELGIKLQQLVAGYKV
ncbi:MAG: methyl-accepting chemotaxis protein [Gammaproteobacteria bacterium]